MKNFIDRIFSPSLKPVLKKRFKCKVCKSCFPISIDMTRKVWWRTGFGDRHVATAFNCPVCDNIYVNFGHSDSWVHECWEFHNIEESN